jgi:hypothetical protein
MAATALHAMVQHLLRGRDHLSSGGRSRRGEGAGELKTRLSDVLSRTYDLGFTAFGGPPVHFQIFHRRFVDGMGKTAWIDEQTVCRL